MTTIFTQPVVPLATLTSPTQADTLADGLVAGELPVVEVTLRHAYGLTAIERLAARGDLMVGAGTVRTAVEARQVIESGAQFIVTPGLDPEVVSVAQDVGVPIIPGVLTATEVLAARRLGVDHVKLFPASSVDALAMLDAYADVFPDVGFMPSAGMSAANISEFLSRPAVFAVSGSWIATAARDGAAAVTTSARAALRAAQSARAAM
ncbi:bifunctional 4-hydroxy-2-oxoglutarate aldolase/2-dehydro-3-deoxy-phosphogluconate aldolase [Mycolicibacterium helvum]|uniref:bifunctional 4-hydroxy-2-oxoglutarate aldolase/2-dehydro-3-deoxy-phosphogluconate aldolase n=1 Tax=Mycolicibacterium helvum TaxID=1534349 RepID=UPI0013D5CB75|nr:bifunctional 4-hydroxy-2-oxoglutarate aldolase/2-dehydro-3-deoxy-phosphogluconate aldolase [Mycolicibacterium helvum]